MRCTSLCSTNQDVVDWDVDELNEVTNESHDSEPNRYSLADLQIFLLGRFCASDEELVSIPHKLLRNLDEFSNFVGHVAVRLWGKDWRWDRSR